MNITNSNQKVILALDKLEYLTLMQALHQANHNNPAVAKMLSDIKQQTPKTK